MTAADLPYEQMRPVTAFASVVLAANPGVMTLDGTNTWVLRAPGSGGAVVVDPGPDDPTHLVAIEAAAPRIEAILLTHGHADHSEGAAALRELTGASVRALDPRQVLGAEGLSEGEVFAAAGLELRVWSTPGHTADSLCFLLDPQDGTPPAVLTGDTVLGRGTTVVAYPDGNLADYLASLRRLRELGPATVLPGHGPELPSAGDAAAAYLAHREQRLVEVAAALERLGPDASPQAVVEIVYAEVDRALWPAAELSVRAQLAYLQGQDR